MLYFCPDIERMYVITTDEVVVPENTIPSNVRAKVQHLNEYLREIYKNPGNLKSYVFGVPIFEDYNISYWLRITTPVDFMIDPFARKNALAGRVAAWMYDVYRHK